MSAGVPSAADDRPKAGAMRRFAKTIAENADADGTIPSPVVAQVVSIRRYFATKGFTAFTQIDLSTEHDRPTIYDIVLSDGMYTQKCLLGPCLNSMVCKGALTDCCFVRVTRGRTRYDETDPARTEPLVIVLGLEVIPFESRVPWFRTNAATHVPVDAITKDMHRPAVGRASSYLHLTRDDGYPDDDPQWKPELEPARDSEEVALIKAWRASHAPGSAVGEFSHSSLAEAIDERRRENAKISPLMLRVLGKSQLKWYGRNKDPEQNVQPVPVQSFLHVGDPTAEAVAVLWNSVNAKFFRGLHVGDIIIVDCYQVRAAKTLFYPDGFPKKLKYEIVLNAMGPNARHKASTVHVVRRAQLLAGVFEHPLVTRTKFLTPERINVGSDGVDSADGDDGAGAATVGDVVDVVGMVVRLGRERRYRVRDMMYSYRWVELRGPESDASSILQLFSASQQGEFDTVLPGMVLACTNAEVMHPTGSSGGEGEEEGSGAATTPWLRSTRISAYTAWYHETQSLPASRPYYGVAEVQNVAEWSLADDAVEMVRAEAMVGGFETWIPRHILMAAGDADDSKLVALASAISAAAELHLTERRVVTVRAKVPWLSFRDNPGSPSSSSDGAGAADAPTDIVWHEVGKRQNKKQRKGAASAGIKTRRGAAGVGAAAAVVAGKGKGHTMDGDVLSGTGFKLAASPAGASFHDGDGDAHAALIPSLTSSVSALLPTLLNGSSLDHSGVWTIALLGLNDDAVMRTSLPVVIPPKATDDASESGSVLALVDLMEDGGFTLPATTSVSPVELATECCSVIQDVQVVASVELFRAGPSDIECTLLALKRPPPSA